MGRWITEDPLGYGGGDFNLNRYVANNALLAIDPAGLQWNIWRNGFGTAGAIATSPIDTIHGLANTVGLSAGQFEKWLTVTDGKSMPTEIQTGLHCREFAVPNTVFAFWTGDMGKVGRSFVQWDANIAYLNARGFKVDEKVNNWKDGSAFTSHVGGLSKSKDLHGIFAWGLGFEDDGGGLSSGDKFKEKVGGTVKGGAGSEFYVYYKDVSKALRYDLALGSFNACYSSQANILMSPNGIFGGSTGILDPTDSGVFGTGTVIHVWDKLEPGDQGTLP